MSTPVSLSLSSSPISQSSSSTSSSLSLGESKDEKKEEKKTKKRSYTLGNHEWSHQPLLQQYIAAVGREVMAKPSDWNDKNIKGKWPRYSAILTSNGLPISTRQLKYIHEKGVLHGWLEDLKRVEEDHGQQPAVYYAKRIQMVTHPVHDHALNMNNYRRSNTSNDLLVTLNLGHMAKLRILLILNG